MIFSDLRLSMIGILRTARCSSAAYSPMGSIVLSACRGDVRGGIVPQTASATRGLVWGY